MGLTPEQKSKWVELVRAGNGTYEFLRQIYEPDLKEWRREFLKNNNFDPPLSDDALEQLHRDSGRVSQEFALAGDNATFAQIAEKSIDWNEVEDIMRNQVREKVATLENIGTRLSAQVQPDAVALTPDGQVDTVQTALNKMRPENGIKSQTNPSSSLREMTEWLRTHKIDSPKQTWWLNFKYDCSEKWWTLRDLLINWRRTLRRAWKITYVMALLIGVLLVIGMIFGAIRHMVYPRWIEPTEDASEIVFYRSHWFANDEIIRLSARVDPENKEAGFVWMKKDGTNWFPFFNFEE